MTAKRFLPAAVALAFVASACSPQALPLPEYASAMEEATDAYIVESQALSETFQNAVTNQISDIVERSDGSVESQATDITKGEMLQYLSLLEDAMGRYLDTISLLTPPAVVSAAHDEYVAAFAGVGGALPEARLSISSAGDLSGIQGALAGSDFRDGQYRLSSTCRSLEAAARSEGTGLDLGCARR